MFDIRREKQPDSILHAVLRLQEGDGRTAERPDQYFILAPEKTPEETRTETFCLSEHQNTAVFPFLSVKWKIDGRWRR